MIDIDIAELKELRNLVLEQVELLKEKADKIIHMLEYMTRDDWK